MVTYTLSVLIFPNKPAGLTRRTIINTLNTIASAKLVEIYALDKLSITPNKIPPNMAPGTLPIPPSTAATNALIPGSDPV